MNFETLLILLSLFVLVGLQKTLAGKPATCIPSHSIRLALANERVDRPPQ